MYQEITAAQLKFDKDEDGERILLGSGGFGTVYLGEYEKIGNAKVAIKRLHNTEKGISNDR